MTGFTLEVFILTVGEMEHNLLLVAFDFGILQDPYIEVFAIHICNI